MARRRGLNFGYFVNTGNESDVTFVEVMEEVIADPRIKVGAGYIEGLKDGRGLMRVAEQALALAKPLVITKVGRTRAGARAIASHSGSLAGVWLAFTEKEADATVRSFVEARAQASKPFIVSWVGIPEHAFERLREHGITVSRGAEPAVDTCAALVRHARLISAVSCLGAAAGARLGELDLNPVLAGPRGAIAVDWLLVLN
jgi:acyl-CoA synthetase (NDP forming)